MMTATRVYNELRLQHSLSEIADKLFLHTGTLKRWEATQKIPNDYLYDLNFLLGNKYDLQKADFRSHNEFFTKKEVAKYCFESFLNFLQIHNINANDYTFIEPSCGDLSFYELMPENSRIGVDLDPESEAVATMGSKEGFVNLARAIINPGDTAIVPTPAYPIHTQAFIIAGGNVAKMPFYYNEKFELDENRFFQNLEQILNENSPRAKYLVVNFPHNPTTVTAQKSFYERLVAVAKKERFYIISDIAYAEICFKDYKTPSIFEVEGAKDVAVEGYTLSKSYNMAGWRVGFMVGNKRLIGALKKIKSWFDYGMYTPIQVAATVALNEDQSCIEQIKQIYTKRLEVMLDAFDNAGWRLLSPSASMFVWAKLPPSKMHLKSLEFSKQLLQRASVAVSPGIGFGEAGDEYVRIALIENENRIRQAARNIKRYLKE